MTFDRDTRLNAVRPDLADRRLEGRFDAARFVEGEPAAVSQSVVNLFRRPERDAPVDTQLLFGEAVTVFETRGGWSWVQATGDGYVGYLPAEALGPPIDAAHWVTALSTYVYPVPDLKSVPLRHLSIGSRLVLSDETETRGLRYTALADDGGFIVSKHVAPVDETVADFVSVAEMFLRVPYLWAGRSAFGVDCSGLIQLAMDMAGQSILRDSDMQEATIGTALPDSAYDTLLRGDLVFWAGHVGIMRDGGTLLHANGNTMDVTAEPLDDAIRRIEPLYGQPTSVRRPT